MTTLSTTGIGRVAGLCTSMHPALSVQADRSIRPVLPLLAMLLMLLLPLVSGCDGQRPAPHAGPSIKVKTAGEITYGTDVCNWCAKTIETVRYGAELVTADGTVLKFRAAEHLVAWMLTHPEKAAEARQVWVVDFADGQKMIGVRDALYLRSTLRPGPGGLHITPIDRENQRMLTNIYEAYPGTFLEWDELLGLVAASDLMPAGTANASITGSGNNGEAKNSPDGTETGVLEPAGKNVAGLTGTSEPASIRN